MSARDDHMLQVLSWQVVYTRLKPPLHPTTAAILMLLGERGVCRMRDFLETLQCTENAIRVQLHRLVQTGTVRVEGRYEEGRRFKLYSLTSAGERTLAHWRRLAGVVFERIISYDK